MNELIGVVLAGGESKRMGQDKSLISYHDMSQYKYVYGQLQKAGCHQIIINSNSLKDDNFTIVEDSDDFNVGGPLKGLLSVQRLFNSSSIFLMGIDYPNIKNSTLQKLVMHYKMYNKSVCYIHPETQKLEPLISIFSNADLQSLNNFYNAGGISIYRFLEFINCDVLAVESMQEFENKNYL